MAELQRPTVGERLKSCRESRGASLADIAATTKMSSRALMAIERDDLNGLPGGIFARGFVRSYAAALGLDAERTVREFMAQFPGEKLDPIEEMSAQSSRRRRIPPGLRAAAPFVLAALPLAIGLVWLTFREADARPRTPLAGDRIAAATAGIAAPMLRPVALVIPSARTGAGEDRASMLNFVLRMRSACWVSVAADGRTIVERLLNSGEVVELSAARVVAFKVGDASAVAMQINGESARSLGGPGQVVTGRIDRSNFRDFLSTP